MKEIKLVLDNDVLERYNEYYFKNHPRARKKPIEKPRHPSINVWCILPRIQMNDLKQKWKDFGVWWIKDLGLDGMMLDNFEVIQTVYFDSKRRSDIDNFTGKFIHDSWSEARFIVDDDYRHFKSLTMKCDYDKEYPRTEFIVRILD